MTKINRSAGCGNSPKNKTVEDIAIALEVRDCEYLSTMLDPEAVWNHSNGPTSTAKQIMHRLLAEGKPAILTIDNAISHGKVGAVNGRFEGVKGEQRFCHIIEFTSAKCIRVARVDSYLN